MALPEIEALVVSEDYFPIAGVFTIAVLGLKNGAKVTGESAVVKPTAFDAEASKAEAKAEALAKVVELEDYLKKQKEFEGTGTGEPTEPGALTFGKAIDALYAGKTVTRPSSTEVIPEVTVKLSDAKTLKGYLGSPEDVAATDWVVGV